MGEMERIEEQGHPQYAMGWGEGCHNPYAPFPGRGFASPSGSESRPRPSDPAFPPDNCGWYADPVDKKIALNHRSVKGKEKVTRELPMDPESDESPPRSPPYVIRPGKGEVLDRPRGGIPPLGGAGAFKSLTVRPPSGSQSSRLVKPEKIPVGNMGQIPIDLGWGSSSASSVVSVGEGPRTVVNVVGQDSGVVGVAHPILGEALKASEVKKFSGKCEDFEEFERAWNHRLKLLHSGGRGALSDALVLTTLKKYLDKASLALLEAEWCTDPDLGYYAFWEKLKSRFQRDVRTTHRHNWGAVKLVTYGSRPTLQEWTEFQAAYLGKRALVEEWGDEEDRRMVFSQVPEQYHQKIMTETQRRRRGQKWIRVGIPQGISSVKVREELEAEVGEPLTKINMEKRHFIVECPREEIYQKLLALDGSKIEGKPLRLQRAEYNMSGEEILAHVSILLQQEDELRLL